LTMRRPRGMVRAAGGEARRARRGPAEGVGVVATDTPDLENIRGALAAADEEDAFWREHYNDYLEQYPEQFVAVSAGKVVATDSDLKQLLRILDKKGLEPRGVWIRFVTADPRRVMS
jgi:hypothetical protein